MENPNPSSKNLLTHQKFRKGPKSSQAQAPAVEAKPAVKTRPHEAALSGKMAKISSMRESGKALPEYKTYSDKAESATSSLPQAMARVHRKQQEDEIRERLQGKSDSRKTENKKIQSTTDLQMEDPDPGFEKSLLWFLFSFGRYAKGVLLVQTLPITFLFWMICGLGSVFLSVNFFMPVAGPGELYNSSITSRVLGGGVLLGMAVYFLVSMGLYAGLQKKFGGIGKFIGLKIVVNAFLPLALLQLLTMGYGTFALGESYWRGNVPAGYTVFTRFLLPGLWIWGGYRVAQAVTGIFNMKTSLKMALKLGVPLILTLPLLVAASGLPDSFSRDLDEEWASLVKDAKSSSVSISLDRYLDLEKRLPLRDVIRRRDLYLYRMQTLYTQDKLEEARADALRLDRMAVPDSAEDELAKGVNYLFQDRLDLAIPRLQEAIRLEPALSPAHQWLLLGLVATDLEKAEEHARILMAAEPDVFHLQLLVRILYSQEKYQDIWDVMLLVDAHPEEWDPVTLYQGGIAAAKTGNMRRSATLLSLARSKGLDSAGE